jgi:hypothetical protein
MSTAGTVTGKGFVISYSVQSGYSNYYNGKYDVTIDSTVVATCTAYSNSANSKNFTATGSHLFFTSKIALAFTSNAGVNASGSMKYILGS